MRKIVFGKLVLGSCWDVFLSPARQHAAISDIEHFNSLNTDQSILFTCKILSCRFCYPPRARWFHIGFCAGHSIFSESGIRPNMIPTTGTPIKTFYLHAKSCLVDFYPPRARWSHIGFCARHLIFSGFGHNSQHDPKTITAT